MSGPPARSGWRLLLAGLARTVLITLGGLLFWSVVPLVLGWQPTVVMSGSMEPRIHVGDVVVTRTVPVEQLRTGHVLLVDDPTGTHARLLHRLERVSPDGALVLHGDANADPDSTPVSADAVHGVGTLRVPWVGQPAVWAANGRYLPVVLTGLGLVVLLLLARIRDDAGEADDE